VDELINFVLLMVNLAILARVILSWVAPNKMDNPLIAIIFQITEPILAPIRKILPSTGAFDFSPIVAIILINIVLSVVQAAI
tara:strand:- start:255 stop:500 length:246 start_codon:yes stop_codon:yes gene_type:complete